MLKLQTKPPKRKTPTFLEGLVSKQEKIEELESEKVTIQRQKDFELGQLEQDRKEQRAREKTKLEGKLTNTKNNLDQMKEREREAEREELIRQLTEQIQTLTKENENLTLNYNQVVKQKHRLEQAAAEVAERINAQTLLPDPKDLDLKK